MDFQYVCYKLTWVANVLFPLVTMNIFSTKCLLTFVFRLYRFEKIPYYKNFLVPTDNQFNYDKLIFKKTLKLPYIFLFTA
jgi:hypothetical protein